jgi:hypothetical protein
LKLMTKQTIIVTNIPLIPPFQGGKLFSSL